MLDASASDRYRGLRKMEFTGGKPGFAVCLLRFPEHKRTVICLSNNNWNPPPWEQARRIADVHLGEVMDPRPPAESAPAAPPKFISVPDQHLKDKVGTYRGPDGMIERIEFRDGNLYHHRFSGWIMPLGALSPARFRSFIPGRGFDLVFERTQDDLPFSLTLVGDG